MPMTSDELREQLRSYGARPEDVAVLDQRADSEDPKYAVRQVRYLDLVRRPENNLDALWPHAAVEVNGQPILYVVENGAGDLPADSPLLTRLRRILWFRAGAEYVALVEPGRLTLYPVGPSERPPTPTRISEGTPDAAALIPTLAFPQATRAPTGATAEDVHKLLLSLLTATTDALIDAGVTPLDALSLVGRALFVRFLVDRNVLSDQEVEEITGVRSEYCFANPERASKMSAWLDETFNGDFLPLPQHGTISWFRKLSDRVFQELTKVLLRAEPTGQLRLTWGDGWNDLLFDHIPVGLLSQVYELHAHRYDADRAEKTSVYYTPRYVAEYMLDEIFSSISDSGKASRASILDPAVGGGVFLVAAFRRLVAERWKLDHKPPNTRILRQILYRQLRGFDISEPALRLCSLGLYLTAIEMDPNPRPPRALKFEEPLLGSVLQHVALKSLKHSYLGSLSSATVGSEHCGKYDLVIGNPPWTSWKKTRTITKEDIDEQVEEVEATVRKIVRERLGNDAAERYEMIDHVPDLPFLWRAMEWAKPDGFIALALSARLLFKQSEAGKQARCDLLSAVQVTGVLNGTALRDTKFWPSLENAPSGFRPAKIRAPFCLLFAINKIPSASSSFFFVSPEMEKGLNDRGRLRIDPNDAQPVELVELLERPALLKMRFRGTTLDSGVMARVEALRLPTLGDYWDSHQYAMGEGFQVVAGGIAVGALADKHVLTKAAAAKMPYLIDVAKLPVLGSVQLHRPRNPRIYVAPLVIVDSTPPVERSRTKSGAHLAMKDVVYNESFFGISCAAISDGELWSRYLFLLLNSRFAIYFALLTSSKFGIERDVFLCEDIKRFPLIPLDRLPIALRNEIAPLSDDLIRQPETSFDAIEQWTASLYGLSRVDAEVIRDTLDVAPPFAHTRARAQGRPDESALRGFGERIRSIIQPFLGRHARCVSVRLIRNESQEPWILFQLDAYPDESKHPNRLDSTALREILEKAESLSASQVIVVHPPATLLIATVAQYRYFTPSRARLTALQIVHEHADALLGIWGRC